MISCMQLKCFISEIKALGTFHRLSLDDRITNCCPSARTTPKSFAHTHTHTQAEKCAKFARRNAHSNSLALSLALARSLVLNAPVNRWR